VAYVVRENLLKNAHDSLYKLVIIASRRAQELGAGSEKLVEATVNTKITSIALKEISENKISFKERDKKKQKKEE